ncbi:hypothetical protein H0H92_012989 [Tricholoma furcatifolium]|nr:hypothetical protein H0H92_012989 [Tricholoma furcatifolium]
MLSLALTSHHICEIALPVLHSRLILKNETDALSVLQRLLTDPEFGRLVRELHILSDLSWETMQSGNEDVIRRFVRVISGGYLPFIHTLGLHLGDAWYYSDIINPNDGPMEFGTFEKGWWLKIKEKCPRLRAAILDGFGDNTYYGNGKEEWIEESGLLHVPFSDALLLAPIFGQLLSLSIHGSVNAQIPYLLRVLCPTGLPKLKSLNIGQEAIGYSCRGYSIEDSGLWYEDKDGVFRLTEEDSSKRTVFDGFMHSIVHSAPNLEEIGFYGDCFPLNELMSVVDDFEQLYLFEIPLLH